MLTRKILKELVHYNPDTGLMTWRTSTPHRTAGHEVGSEFTSKCGKKYRHVMLKNRMYLVHRLVFLYMVGEFPSKQVDHISGNGTDNRWENLREVSSTGNSRNRRMNHNNSSGCAGVIWYPRYDKWLVRIGMYGKKVTLGYFDDLQEAIIVRKTAETEIGFHPNHGSTRPL